MGATAAPARQRPNAATAREPVDTDGGEGERLFMSVAAQPDKQGMLVQQPDPTSEGMDLQPRIERLLHGQRHRDLTLAAGPCRARTGDSAGRLHEDSTT